MMNKIKWLRISYWTAAIADFVIAILVLIPGLVGVSSYVYPMGMVSVIGISWGILLILADRNPLTRRWVIIPTMIVVALLGFTTLHALSLKVVHRELIIGGVASSVVIFLLLLFSYLNSRETCPRQFPT